MRYPGRGRGCQGPSVAGAAATLIREGACKGVCSAKASTNLRRDCVAVCHAVMERCWVYMTISAQRKKIGKERYTDTVHFSSADCCYLLLLLALSCRQGLAAAPRNLHGESHRHLSLDSAALVFTSSMSRPATPPSACRHRPRRPAWAPRALASSRTRPGERSSFRHACRHAKPRHTRAHRVSVYVCLQTELPGTDRGVGRCGVWARHVMAVAVTLRSAMLWRTHLAVQMARVPGCMHGVLP